MHKSPRKYFLDVSKRCPFRGSFRDGLINIIHNIPAKTRTNKLTTIEITHIIFNIQNLVEFIFYVANSSCKALRNLLGLRVAIQNDIFQGIIFYVGEFVDSIKHGHISDFCCISVKQISTRQLQSPDHFSYRPSRFLKHIVVFYHNV